MNAQLELTTSGQVQAEYKPSQTKLPQLATNEIQNSQSYIFKLKDKSKINNGDINKYYKKAGIKPLPFGKKLKIKNTNKTNINNGDITKYYKKKPGLSPSQLALMIKIIWT